MNIYQIGEDSVEIIDIGYKGILLANHVYFSSVFAGTLYKEDDIIGTIMCRREVATTNEFMRTLDAALAPYNSTEFTVKPILFETGRGTNTKKYYDKLSPSTPRGTHSQTNYELMNNLNNRFSIKHSQLRSLQQCAPGNFSHGRSSKLTVHADGRTEIALIRHLQSNHFVPPGRLSNTILPSLVRTVEAPAPIHTIPQQYIGTDDTMHIKKGSRGTIMATDMQVCSVFVGKLFRQGHYKGTIACRRGIGPSQNFAYSVNRVLREYHNHTTLVCQPIVIMAGITTDTMLYKKASLTTGTILPASLANHARTDEELIKNLSSILKIPQDELKKVSRTEFCMANNIIGMQVIVNSVGTLHFNSEKNRLSPMTPLPGPSGTVPTATVTSSSIPPGTVPLPAIPPATVQFLPSAPGVLPPLDIFDEDFL